MQDFPQINSICDLLQTFCYVHTLWRRTKVQHTLQSRTGAKEIKKRKLSPATDTAMSPVPTGVCLQDQQQNEQGRWEREAVSNLYHTPIATNTDWNEARQAEIDTGDIITSFYSCL